MATRPTHIYSSSLNRRDKRWRSKRRRVFVVGSISRVGVLAAGTGATLVAAVELLFV